MRILFADPSRDLVQIYEKLLNRDGYETVPAFDGLQALEYLKNERFDAAVLREELPRYDTRNLLALLKEQNVPCLLLQEKQAEQDDSGRIAFPFLPSELEERIKEVTQHE